MSFEKIQTEARRGAILRLLFGDSDERINDAVMQAALGQLGHSVRRETVRADFAFLAEQELIVIEDLGDYQVACLTGFGAEVAQGRAAAPGVKRHRPGG